MLNHGLFGVCLISQCGAHKRDVNVRLDSPHEYYSYLRIKNRSDSGVNHSYKYNTPFTIVISKINHNTPY